MKLHFSQIFEITNGQIAPKVPVHVNGITMTPGVSFSSGVSFGGVDLTQFIGKYLEVENQGGVIVISGYYQ